MTTAIIYELYNRKKLEDLCVTIHGTVVPKIACLTTCKPIPYIRSSDINSKNIDSPKANISPEAVSSGNVKLVPGNNILIAVTGPTAGKIALLKHDAAIDPSVMAVINHNEAHLDTLFLYYYLLCKIPSLIKISNSGTRIIGYRLSKLEILLPSLLQQKKAVQRIEAQLKDVDMRISDLKVLVNELNDKKNNVLEIAFKKIADSQYSKKVKITSIAQVQPGRTPSQSIPEYFGSSYPLFKPSATEQGKAMQSSKIMLSERGIKVARLVPAMSVLVVFAGNLLGKAGINVVPAAGNGQMIAVIPLKAVDVDFIYYQLQCMFIQNQMKAMSVNDVLTKAKFEELDFFYLPLKAQVQLVASLDKDLNVIQNELTDAQAAICSALKRRAEIVKTLLG